VKLEERDIEFIIDDRLHFKIIKKKNITTKRPITVNLILNGLLSSFRKNDFFDICELGNAVNTAARFSDNSEIKKINVYRYNIRELHVKRFEELNNETIAELFGMIFRWFKLDQIYDLVIEPYQIPEKILFKPFTPGSISEKTSESLEASNKKPGLIRRIFNKITFSN